VNNLGVLNRKRNVATSDKSVKRALRFASSSPDGDHRLGNSAEARFRRPAAVAAEISTTGVLLSSSDATARLIGDVRALFAASNCPVAAASSESAVHLSVT
jgi:hypothetical protein